MRYMGHKGYSPSTMCCFVFLDVSQDYVARYWITVKFLNFWTPDIPKIQEKRPKLWVFLQKDANGIASSEEPDQTAPL